MQNQAHAEYRVHPEPTLVPTCTLHAHIRAVCKLKVEASWICKDAGYNVSDIPFRVNRSGPAKLIVTGYLAADLRQ